MSHTVGFSQFWSFAPEFLRRGISNIDSHYWEDDNFYEVILDAFQKKILTEEDYHRSIACISAMTLIADTYLGVKQDNACIGLLQEGALETAINVISVVPSLSSLNGLELAKFLGKEAKLGFSALCILLNSKDRQAILKSDQLFMEFAARESELREIYGTAKNI